MPRLTQPPGQPREVTQAIETIGSAARTEILKCLYVRGPQTVPQLADAAGSSLMSAQRHVTALERAGLVAGDPPPSDRGPGRVVTWHVVPEAVESVPVLWLRYVKGEVAETE